VNAPADEEDEIVEGATSHNGLMCFLDSSRDCGADCMAYTAEASENKAMSTQQRNCLVLVSIDRLGRFMGNMATSAHKMQTRAATEAADRVRQSQSAPPNPLGVKA
jgi:hypothetical protein